MRFMLSMLFIIASLIAGDKMSIYEIEVKDIDGKIIQLDTYKNRVMLIVNVASKCGYTGQYKGLQKLHENYGDKGLSVLGFPCNQFLAQEPGTEDQIKNFCLTNFGVEFDMFAKIKVNGKETHPLYLFLKEGAGGFATDAIKWNFTKFLVDKNGKVFKRYAPSVKPSEIEDDIKKLL